MFVKNSEVESQYAGERTTRKILGTGDKLMMVEVTFEKGAVGTIHTHPHEQVSYIAKGSFEFNLNGDKRVISQGDSVYIGPDLPHGTLSLEEGSIIVDIFTPIREDFLK